MDTVAAIAKMVTMDMERQDVDQVVEVEKNALPRISGENNHCQHQNDHSRPVQQKQVTGLFSVPAVLLTISFPPMNGIPDCDPGSASGVGGGGARGVVHDLVLAGFGSLQLSRDAGRRT